MRSLGVLALVVVAVLAGCPDEPPAPEPRRIEPPQRRVIEPPTGTVRPLPPYAITATEVGPYKLGQKLAALLDKLPSGPRIARFEIPGVVHTSLIRAEDGQIVIGSEPATSVASSKTSFVAVLRSEVARTESGIHVGSTRKELEKAGAFAEDLDVARDPRLVTSSVMRNKRFVFDDDHVIAIVVGEVAPRRPVIDPNACPRPIAKHGMFGACLTGAGELVEVADDWITVRAVESEKAITTIRVPNLVFAAALRNPNDGRDELVAVARTDEAQVRTWTIVAFRFDGRRHVVIVEPTPLYQLSPAQTRWIGADLRDVELYLELTSRATTIEVGGLLTARAGDKVRDIVVISPVTVPRRQPGKSVPGEPTDAGVPDADPTSGADSAKL